jgi:hypothetical protein
MQNKLIIKSPDLFIDLLLMGFRLIHNSNLCKYKKKCKIKTGLLSSTPEMTVKNDARLLLILILFPIYSS